MNESVGVEQKIQQYILAQESWVLALQGILALIIGFLILTWPAMTVVMLAIFVGAFAFADGIFALVALTKAEKWRRGLLILHGVVGIAFGLIILIWPGISTVMLLWFIMAWILVTGIFKLVAAFALPKGDSSKWLLALNGILSVIIGVLLISLPAAEGLLVMAILIGFYGIFGGITLISLAFMVNSMQAQVAA